MFCPAIVRKCKTLYLTLRDYANSTGPGTNGTSRDLILYDVIVLNANSLDLVITTYFLKSARGSLSSSPRYSSRITQATVDGMVCQWMAPISIFTPPSNLPTAKCLLWPSIWARSWKRGWR